MNGLRSLVFGWDLRTAVIARRNWVWIIFGVELMCGTINTANYACIWCKHIFKITISWSAHAFGCESCLHLGHAEFAIRSKMKFDSLFLANRHGIKSVAYSDLDGLSFANWGDFVANLMAVSRAKIATRRLQLDLTPINSGFLCVSSVGRFGSGLPRSLVFQLIDVFLRMPNRPRPRMVFVDARTRQSITVILRIERFKCPFIFTLPTVLPPASGALSIHFICQELPKAIHWNAKHCGIGILVNASGAEDVIPSNSS